MWAVIVYEPPNRANCQHDISSTLYFEELLAACTGTVKLIPSFLTNYFILDSIKIAITVVETNLYCLSLSKSVHSASVGCVLEYYYKL